MAPSTKHIAESASFQAFVNGFIRETGAGCIKVLTTVDEVELQQKMHGPFIMELHLPIQKTTLWIDVPYRSLVGRHTFGDVFRIKQGGKWQQEEPFSAMILLVQELHAQAKSNPEKRSSCFEECLLRMIDSLQTMHSYIEVRQKDGGNYTKVNNVLLIRNSRSCMAIGSIQHRKVGRVWLIGNIHYMHRS